MELNRDELHLRRPYPRYGRVGVLKTVYGVPRFTGLLKGASYGGAGLLVYGV